MKTLFTVQVRKADQSLEHQNVLAEDAGGKPAIIAAIEAALTAAGTGSVFQSANMLGKVDTDATGV